MESSNSNGLSKREKSDRCNGQEDQQKRRNTHSSRENGGLEDDILSMREAQIPKDSSSVLSGRLDIAPIL